MIKETINQEDQITLIIDEESSFPPTKEDQARLDKLYDECKARLKQLTALPDITDIRHEAKKTHIKAIMEYGNLIKEESFHYAYFLSNPFIYDYQYESYKARLKNVLKMIELELEEYNFKE